MALIPEDREDLIRDATQYANRLQFAFFDGEEPTRLRTIFWGQRQNGSWSLYIDQDPVLQFNSNHQLRRLFCANVRFVAEGGKMLELRRLGPDGQPGKLQFERIAIPEERWKLMCSEWSKMFQSIVDAGRDPTQLQHVEFVLDSDQKTESTALNIAFNCIQNVKTEFAIADSANAI